MSGRPLTIDLSGAEIIEIADALVNTGAEGKLYRCASGTIQVAIPVADSFLYFWQDEILQKSNKMTMMEYSFRFNDWRVRGTVYKSDSGKSANFLQDLEGDPEQIVYDLIMIRMRL